VSRIAILGWGSLIRELGCLEDYVHLPWKPGGPLLPLEFSRKSETRKGALTLVIDQKNGVKLPTRFIESKRSDPCDAACDLRTREKTVIRSIGLIDVRQDLVKSETPEIEETIREWAKQHSFQAVVWTALPSNCDNFSVENAVAYLKGLSGQAVREARRYIKNAPIEIETPLRRALNQDGWLNSRSRSRNLSRMSGRPKRS
jgi:hypothetical protein